MSDFLCPAVGDVDASGVVDAEDAARIIQYSNLNYPFPFLPQVADTDCDGSIDDQDAAMVEQFVAGTVTSLGCDY
jgi:hypothetical protein